MIRVLAVSVLLMLCCTFISTQQDQILSLPGYGPISSNAKQFAGFLPVDATGEGNLFYWYFEKVNKATSTNTPLIIWVRFFAFF